MLQERIDFIKTKFNSESVKPIKISKRLQFLWNWLVGENLTQKEISDIYENVFSKKLDQSYTNMFLKQFSDIEHVCSRKLIPTGKKRNPYSYSINNIMSDGDLQLCVKNINAKFRKSKRKYKKFTKTTSETIIEKFDNESSTVNKRYIESIFINQIKCYIPDNCSVISLTGPDYERHIEMFFNSFASEVTFVEFRPKIFDVILDKAKKCKYFKKGKVNLFLGDITKAGNYEATYQDLDFCQSFQTILPILKQRLQAQLQNSKENISATSFTFSCRHGKKGNTLSNDFASLMRESLGCIITGFDGVVGGCGSGTKLLLKSQLKNYCNQHIPIITHPGRVISLNVFGYCDSSSMISCLIIYKSN